MDKTTLENLRNAPECFAPTRELVFAMLDTISALTERAERAEAQLAKLDQAWIDLQADIIEAAAIPFGHSTVAYVRELRERAERAERERDEARRMNDDDTKRLSDALQIERELRTDLARLREAMPSETELAAIEGLATASPEKANRSAANAAMRFVARIDTARNGGLVMAKQTGCVLDNGHVAECYVGAKRYTCDDARRDAEIARLRAELEAARLDAMDARRRLAETLMERDARPEISREDAAVYLSRRLTDETWSVRDLVHEALRAHAARAASEPATSRHWWCTSCGCEVDPVHVTYHETHDECGGDVVPRAASEPGRCEVGKPNHAIFGKTCARHGVAFCDPCYRARGDVDYTCEFCGCRTNARLRACCEKGRAADIRKAPAQIDAGRCERCTGDGSLTFSSDRDAYEVACIDCNGTGRKGER